MRPIAAIRRLIADVRLGQACRYIRKEDREAAEAGLATIELVLRQMESNADINEDGSVVLPLAIFDKLRDLQG